MAQENTNTLRELRRVAMQLRKAEALSEALRKRRDELICKAAAEGHSQRRIAIAAMCSQALVNQVLNTT